MVSSCNILSKDTNEISVMEWVLADQQNINRSGKQSTQLELGVSKLPVENVVKKLVLHLNIFQTHQQK